MAEKLSSGLEKFGVDERKWRDVGAGLSVLDLHELNGRRLQLVRISPGGRIMAHRHEGAEVMIVTKGSIILDGTTLRVGEVMISPAGTMHRETWSAEGCEIVIECSPDDTLLRS